MRGHDQISLFSGVSRILKQNCQILSHLGQNHQTFPTFWLVLSDFSTLLGFFWRKKHYLSLIATPQHVRKSYEILEGFWKNFGSPFPPYTSAWNNRRSSVTVWHDFMCGRQDSFSVGHNTEDRHELWVTGTKCRLPDTMSGTGEIFISGAAK